MRRPTTAGQGRGAAELPTPFEAHADTSRHGPLFWTGVGIGWLVIGFGVWSLITKPGATHPPEAAAWIVGLALAHDLVLAPIALTVAWILRRVVPRIARGLVLGALAISAIVALYALPLVRRFGAQADNPSFLPRNAGAGLVLVIALVWAAAALLLAARLWGRPEPRGGAR
ncbi:MAG TPA: hypothetical protein VIG53_01220 [Actinomycetota bacterium]